MAEEDKSNIIPEYNNATNGLNLDQSLNQIPKGKLTYALNATVENFDSNSVNYQNEAGNELCFSFPENYMLIGEHFINEQNKHIFFLVNDITGDSEIGYMENNDCQYHTLLNDICLGFDKNFPIHKIVHRITNCTTEIYWPDKLGRRYLDLNNIPYKLESGSALCNPVYSKEIDCNRLRVQPSFSIPILSISKVTTGGELVSGTYQFTVQYADAKGNPYTSYFSITNPTPIADNQIATVNFNYPVGKSIVINVDNLDSTGQFQYVNLAVLKTINAITSVELVGTYFIDSENKQFTYTGQNVEQTRLSINDIFEKFPYYDLADDVTAAQDILIWKGLTTIERINYQQIANKIDLQWETYRIPSTEDYSDELNATNFRGYLRDEVYPFEIQFLLSSGKETDSFHIPGRVKGNLEISIPDIPETNEDFIGPADYVSGGIGYSPYWKIYNTATVEGVSNKFTSSKDYKGPYQYGKFGYWESTEEYPCNSSVWGELAGQKIRHHKFPDISVSPIYENREFSTIDNMTMEDNAIYPIGVKVDSSQIQGFINTSNLTKAQKEDIVGFKILRGDRVTNKSIVAKGILRNVNKYTRERQDYYYPNYPYNDLGDDPFLNQNNNAYSLICETYEVNITKLGDDPDGGPAYAEVQYTDCNTNKQTKEKIFEVKSYTKCSTSQPVVLSPAEGTSGLASYEIWTASRNCWLCRGYRVAWNDVVTGPTEKWISGGTFEMHVVIDSGAPEKVDGKGASNIKYIGLNTSDVACNTETPQPSILSNHDLGYRQIFNSPETSFGQPFLGNVLKLESTIFGKGEAHFAEVKKNAKYKLLTEEAQRDALNSSRDLGSITSPFNPTAMFSAYQSYLTIYTNGITRKNYGYSFNSIANYDYSRSVPNGLGIKQRELDIKKYLIPGIQAVGDDFAINNYNRETSVFLKTNKEKTPLLFPSESPEMLNNGVPIVSDSSRFSVSEVNNCDVPAKKNPISVVSYYASLKNVFNNQWGQIYSYTTIDTGYKKLFGTSLENDTIFGGDTFINRFAFKTKVPFFFDNRVGAPDDSDIFYDEIGNIAYPKYWHSARSILKDFTIPGTGVLSNIISYKAHNFDCPNSQEPGPDSDDPIEAEKNPNRTFYDGYFYLFAYGVPNFYCESSYNMGLRQAFNNKEGDFWPHVSSDIPDDWFQESNVSILNDNTYNYNVTYSKQNKENYFTHLPIDWEQKLCYTNYPFRAIYSDLQNTDADDRVNNWLVYRSLSYYDFPQNYGKLISLDGIQNRAILARFENKSLLYNSLLTINTSNPQAAYVGNSVMFKGAPPIDFAETDLGYVGSQHKMLLKIPQGQVSIDAKRGQVFLIEGTKVTDLSGFGSGLNRFFTDHLAFEILRFFPKTDVDNHFNGIGLHGVFDSKFERIIISKLDYIPLDKNIKYDETLKEFYIDKAFGEHTIRTVVDVKDSEKFCNKSWTLSFNLNTKSWISFHSYIPNWYIAENNFFYSGQNNCCSDFDFVAASLLEDPITTTTTSTTKIKMTTTTTTQYSYRCNPLNGFITVRDCAMNFSGVIIEETPPAACTRPDNVVIFDLYKGYTILSTATTIESYTTQAEACSAIGVINDNPDPETNIQPTILYAEAESLSLLNKVYAFNGTNDCSFIPDGWYFTEESMFYNNIYEIVNGIIVQITSCPVYDCSIIGNVVEQITTTTTSTTVAPTTTTTSTIAPTTTSTTTIPVTTTTTTNSPTTTTTTTTVVPTTTTTTTNTPTTTTTTTVATLDCTLGGTAIEQVPPF